MGGALLKGWIASGQFNAIRVVEPSPSQALRDLAAKGSIALSADLAHANLDDLCAAVIAIKPQILKTQVTMLQHLGATRAIVVSIAAGVTAGFLRSALGPSCDIVRAMPNLPGAVGRGVIALHAAAGTAADDRAFAESLMTPLGETFWVADEALIDSVTATSGSGPAYVFYLIECLTAAAIAQGLAPDLAAKIARATITGAGARSTPIRARPPICART